MARVSAENGENGTLDNTLLVNGSINVRLTHPNLYYLMMVFAIVSLLLGLNFLILHPTFLIYGQSNWLWGSIFVVTGILKLFFLNFHRGLRTMRILMAFTVGYSLWLAGGTMQPFFEGQGSLQLPILYVALAAAQYPLILEPFVNPSTRR